MEDSMPTLEELIRLVEDISRDADPLQSLTDAVIVSGRITDLADELVGHFVEIARETGATWAEIGDCMGVSKQAVQKRFRGGPRRAVGAGGFFVTRLADNARSVVRRAVAHVHEMGSAEVGTEHLVLGIVDDPECRAARAITGLGVSLDLIRTAIECDDSSPTPDDDRRRDTEPRGPRLHYGMPRVPFSAASKKVLELALRERIRSAGRGQIDTGHILLAILRDAKSPGARALIDHGIDLRSVATWLEEN